MANWSLPGLTDLYSNFLTYLKGRDDDAVRMNDTRTTAATNVPDYSKRWNDTTKTIQNYLSAAWSNLVLGVAGGGTGGSTAADARTNLDVYSKAETAALDAAASALTTVSGQLTSEVVLSSAATYYDGPSITITPGTWLIIAAVDIFWAGNCVVTSRLLSGATVLSIGVAAIVNYADLYGPFHTGFAVATPPVFLSGIVTVGSNTTVKTQAQSSVAAGSSAGAEIYGHATDRRTYITAIKVG